MEQNACHRGEAEEELQVDDQSPSSNRCPRAAVDTHAIHVAARRKRAKVLSDRALTCVACFIAVSHLVMIPGAALEKPRWGRSGQSPSIGSTVDGGQCEERRDSQA